MMAAINGRVETARLLLEKGAGLNDKNDLGFTPLICAAYLGRPEVTQMLIKAGAKLDEQDNRGGSALMRAVSEHNAQDIRLLLEAGANPDLKNEEGHTAHDIAVRDGQMELAEMIADFAQKMKTAAAHKKVMGKQAALKTVAHKLKLKPPAP
jgi:ankyrin repeat protein